jgi:hypothetical protein
MDKKLADVISKIGDEYKHRILAGSRFYIEVSIGKKAEKYGYQELKEKYRNIQAIIPLKQPVAGMKVRVDGRTFVNYAQFDSGVVVPAYVANNAKLTYNTFIPNDSMIYNFS